MNPASGLGAIFSVFIIFCSSSLVLLLTPLNSSSEVDDIEDLVLGMMQNPVICHFSRPPRGRLLWVLWGEDVGVNATPCVTEVKGISSCSWPSERQSLAGGGGGDQGPVTRGWWPGRVTQHQYNNLTATQATTTAASPATSTEASTTTASTTKSTQS